MVVDSILSLSVPEPCNSLGDADVVGLEGVQSYAQGDGRDPEGPHGGGAGLGDTVLGEVVDDACSIDYALALTYNDGPVLVNWRAVLVL